ncbi:adenylosuccinate synthetase, partial [Oenococcus oeni]
ENAVPVYETIPGWSEDISEVQRRQDLPVNAQNYLNRIEDLLKTPILAFAVGPHAEQTHLLKDPWSEDKEVLHTI